jgi:methylated-DNA-[protein]-cysteine S-methyltransferase
MSTESTTRPVTETTWHTVVPTELLGDLTVVRDTDAITGLYFRHHWNLCDRSIFGERRDEGFDAAATQLHEYLAGERTAFDLRLRADGDELQQRVWDLLRGIPYGRTTTYGELAAAVAPDRSITAQQVGQAVGSNPLSVFVACHRVLGRGNKLVGYAGGLARKRALLELEYSTSAKLDGDTAGRLW